MGCRHSIHVVNFAVGSFATVKFFAVPGGHTLLAIVFTTGKHKIGFAKNGVGAFITNSGNGFHLGNSIWDTAGIHWRTWPIFGFWQHQWHSGTACQNKTGDKINR